jgi:CMP-N-acetylneuraminic acid synthetase
MYDYNAIGIVAVKSNSKRFPNKNIHLFNGKPLFLDSILALKNCKRIEKLFVTTDSVVIEKHCKKYSVEVIKRNKNMINDEEPLLNVLRYAYQTINYRARFIVTVMANCPGHDSEMIDNAIELISKKEFNEIRSFNDSGEESGLIILKENVLMKYCNISSHIGMVSVNAKEIHYYEDLEKINVNK